MNLFQNMNVNICEWKSCKKEFQFKYDFHKHLILHVTSNKKTKSNMYTCHFKNCNYKSKSLKDHILVHVKNYFPFSCISCFSKFKTKSGFYKHQKKSCVQKRCNICDISFCRQANYATHKKFHQESFIQIVDFLFS